MIPERMREAMLLVLGKETTRKHLPELRDGTYARICQ